MQHPRPRQRSGSALEKQSYFRFIRVIDGLEGKKCDLPDEPSWPTPAGESEAFRAHSFHRSLFSDTNSPKFKDTRQGLPSYEESLQIGLTNPTLVITTGAQDTELALLAD